MKSKNVSIWYLALGYFAFYVPYSGMTKLLSKGMFSETGNSISGAELLPAVLMGTVLGFILILLFTGWWKYAGKINILGLKVPFATHRFTFFSGIATAVIIATTTLAYSFTGISIVFAALLMRGGVLLMAPFIDKVYKRKIQWYSWLAFGLTLFSLLIVFSEKAAYNLSMAAGVNIIAYLSGYFFRLQFMTYSAKTKDKNSNYKFFVEEMLSAALVILILPAILALMATGGFLLQIRDGYTLFLKTGLLPVAMGIGLLYAGLYIFGSRIYLDKRENTFCIPINRAMSLQAGVVAALILTMVFETPFYSPMQITGAIFLMLAIFALSTPKIIEIIRGQPYSQRTYMFVCPGNTGRSPMAQAICIDKMVSFLQTDSKKNKSPKVTVLSAGINTEGGRPIHENAQQALQHLGVSVLPHHSKRISNDDLDKVDKVWCMTQDHKDLILQKFPGMESKIHYLDLDGSLPVPHGKGIRAYIECAEKLEQIIDNLIRKEEIQFT
ncbi:arsenate reductase/protein-tyrosine-phosphatase family protein [Aureisphaera sp.]